MSFFKKYNGTTNARLVRIERWTWLFIYGGLVAYVLGHFVGEVDVVLARTMEFGGIVGVGLGIVLLLLRAKMKEES
jgi:hypothetical protein